MFSKKLTELHNVNNNNKPDNKLLLNYYYQIIIIYLFITPKQQNITHYITASINTTESTTVS